MWGPSQVPFMCTGYRKPTIVASMMHCSFVKEVWGGGGELCVSRFLLNALAEDIQEFLLSLLSVLFHVLCVWGLDSVAVAYTSNAIQFCTVCRTVLYSTTWNKTVWITKCCSSRRRVGGRVVVDVDL